MYVFLFFRFYFKFICILWALDVCVLCVCVCACACACVCVGRYCRSSCSCCISCKEHESPGNAQKHQHWWHQHKSAKPTLLQIVAVRSGACRCELTFTMMQSVYQNLELLTFIRNTPSLRYCVIWHSLICCYLFVFLLKRTVFYVLFFFLLYWKMKYLFIFGTFVLPRRGLALNI